MTVTAVGEGLGAAIAARFNDGGAPFVRDLGVCIDEAEPGRVRFTLPVTERLTHAGRVLCGQAIMACMDVGMVFVMMSLNDAQATNFTTVELKTTFERGVPDDVGQVAFDARASRPGRTLVFSEVELFLPDGRRAAHATTTAMWLPDLAG